MRPSEPAVAPAENVAGNFVMALTGHYSVTYAKNPLRISYKLLSCTITRRAASEEVNALMVMPRAIVFNDEPTNPAKEVMLFRSLLSRRSPSLIDGMAS